MNTASQLPSLLPSNLSRPPAHTLPHTNLHVRKHISNLQLQMCNLFPPTWISRSQLSVAVDDGFLTGTIQPVNYHLPRLARKRKETVPKAVLAWKQTPRCREGHLWWHVLPSIGLFQNRIWFKTNLQLQRGKYECLPVCSVLLSPASAVRQWSTDHMQEREGVTERWRGGVFSGRGGERGRERESKRAAVVTILCWACRE